MSIVTTPLSLHSNLMKEYTMKQQEQQEQHHCGTKRSRTMMVSTPLPTFPILRPNKIVRINSAYSRTPAQLHNTANNATKGSDSSSTLTHSKTATPLSPQGYLEAVTKRAITPSLKADPEFFLKHTQAQLDAYDHDVTAAVRNGNLERLRELHKAGRTLQCSNRFGESLIHIACRRGLLDIVRFLTKEANVTLNVRDDYGRTPLHDACWTATPNTELFEFIMKESPDLLFFSDQRGHSPLQYVRRDHWPIWMSFLKEQQLELL